MDEVSDIKKELERTIPSNDGKRALELLRSLESIPMSIDILQTTHIGLTVNKIRKEIANPEVVSLSKSMVKKWKKLVAPSSNSTSSGNSNNNSTSNNSHGGITSNDSKTNNNGNSTSLQASVVSHVPGSGASAGQTSTSITNSGNNSSAHISNSTAYSSSDSSVPSRSPTTHSISNQKESNSQSTAGNHRDRPTPLQTEVPSTTCQVRLKSRQLLASTLKKPLPEELQSEPFLEEDILAARIEETIFQEFKSTDPKYKNRIRSRVSNLGDSRNPYLRYKVLMGDISPDRIAKMTAEEMASDDLKKERERYTKESINDRQMSLTTGTRTSEIKCPACKKYDVTYNQMQTRSADEPMTTFCHCNECGKRWKFC